MSKIYFTNVLDDPYYVSNGIFLSVVTNGKVRVEGEESRDYNKDSAAKAGLLKIDTKNEKVKFIDFSSLSENGDSYRGVVVVDDYAYVMRTQKKHVDSKVRMAKVNLKDDSVEMFEDAAISIHGVETPKTFCGHFNFGRPIAVDGKIIYPPLNSGVIIVYDTSENKMISIDVADDAASIQSVYLKETNEVLFFPYGNTSNKLMVLSLTDHSVKYVSAPVDGSFYGAVSSGNKVVGLPLSMNETTQLNFWIYNGSEIVTVPYTLDETASATGQLGFKYGVVIDNQLVAHSCWDRCQELISLNLDTLELTTTKTNNALGSTPIAGKDIMLLPSVQHPSMTSVIGSAFTITNKELVESFKLETNNIYAGVSSYDNHKAVTVPFRFDLEDNVLKSELMFVDTDNKTSKKISIELEIE
jgi:hypothetical protein